MTGVQTCALPICWRRIVLLLLLAGLAALGWNRYTWHRAVRQLEEAGITAEEPSEGLGARLLKIAQNDWRRLFNARAWRAKTILWRMDSAKAGQLHNLDNLASALRRINPEALDLSGCPALENVDGLKGLTALQQVGLGNCTALRDVNGLKGLSSLESVLLPGRGKLREDDVSALRAALPNAFINFFPPHVSGIPQSD